MLNRIFPIYFFFVQTFKHEQKYAKIYENNIEFEIDKGQNAFVQNLSCFIKKTLVWNNKYRERGAKREQNAEIITPMTLATRPIQSTEFEL